MTDIFISLIPNAITYRLPYYLKYELLFQKAKSDVSQFKSILNKRKVFVFLSADYGNMGDVAITIAQIQILKKKYPDYLIVEVLASNCFKDIKSIYDICRPNDIVTIIGGGNMGDLYYDFQILREIVILKFKHNRVISFPQTIDFSNTQKGKKRLSISKKIYSKHPNLTILSREKKSYKLMKEFFPKNKVFLTPDVVLALDYTNIIQKDRRGVIFSMRNDAEKFLDSEQHHAIETYFEKKFDSLKYCDTHIGKKCLTDIERRAELNIILQKFSSAQVVVTDRLHGMIFSYITGTPAIVFPNGNSKVENCYEWIKECGFIEFVKEVNVLQLDNLVDKVSSTKIDLVKFIDRKKKFENLLFNSI